jgi:hypothetical protein
MFEIGGMKKLVISFFVVTGVAITLAASPVE